MYVIIGIIIFLFVAEVKLEECMTPNKEKAECVSLYACPVLIGALATQQQTSIEFVRQSNCGGTSSNPMVCCGSSTNFIIDTNKNNNNSSQNVTAKLNLLPSRRYCGYQHSDDYISTKNDSLPAITEFPWLVGLAYNITNNLEIACGGSLISKRYVLTAAHCVDTKRWASIVYLGEYHINNKTDCVREPPFDEECSTPEVFGVEKTIINPMYDGIHKYTSITNDIALLRLDRTVTYSDYIRPVCLPLPGTTFAKVGDVLTSSGWGFNDRSEDKRAEIKKKISNTLIENKQCAQAFRNESIFINENQLCTVALNQSLNVECRGDSGGPLLFSHRNQWHQEGVISFGVGCDNRYPHVYTKVVNYIDWILESIEK